MYFMLHYGVSKEKGKLQNQFIVQCKFNSFSVLIARLQIEMFTYIIIFCSLFMR